MNGVFHLFPLVRTGMAIAIISVLAACGQRGPLYLPKGESSTMISKPTTQVDPTATQNATDASLTTAPSTQKKDAKDDSSQNNQQK